MRSLDGGPVGAEHGWFTILFVMVRWKRLVPLVGRRVAGKPARQLVFLTGRSLRFHRWPGLQSGGG